MTNAKIAAENQKLSGDTQIHLYKLDATAIGGDVYCFTSAAYSDSAIVFDGQAYTPVDIKVEGFEWNGQGSLPTPRVHLEKITLSMRAILRSTSNLQGAIFTRTRTYAKFLDDGSDPDPDAIQSYDVYIVERLIGASKREVELELAASIDQQGRRIGKQMLRDYCPLIYRVFDPVTETFDYTKATCPYDGNDFFKADGTQTDNPAEDVPSKTFNNCCRKRFGSAPKPFGGYPGLAKVRA